MSAAEALQLNAWLQRERKAGRTRHYSSVQEMLRKTRPGGKKTRS